MFGISFLSPWFLAGAVAVAVPILLHLFHRRTEVVIDFPAVSLLTRAPVQQHRRRRLRELVLLALRVTAIVLLAASFARPYLAGTMAPESAPLTVIAVDTSLSLSAPGQIDRLKSAAAAALDAAPPSHAVALVAFADAATVLVEPTTDRGALTAALAGLAAGHGGTRYRTALARANELVGARDGRVVVITDLQAAGWETNDDGGLADGVSLEVVGVPGPTANLAVTSAARSERGVVASIQNYGHDEVRTLVTVLADAKEAARADVLVAPLAATEVELVAALPRSGSAEVRVDDGRGYQLDNVRVVALDAAAATPVTIVVADPTVATGGLYLERALSVAGGGREFGVEVLDGRDVAKVAAAEFAGRAAVFLLGTRTLDRAGRERVRTYLAGGGQVFLAFGADVDPGTLADVLGVEAGFVAEPVRTAGATMVASDTRHPIFRPFLSPSAALGDVQVDQYRRLNQQADRTVLARFTGGDAALTEQPAGKGRLMIYPSDLDNQWSRFPLNPAFVPFAVETARYLTRQERQSRPSPGGATADESNPASTSVEAFTNAVDRMPRVAATDVPSAARDVEERQRWWQVGLVLMLAALAGEAVVGRRTT